MENRLTIPEIGEKHSFITCRNSQGAEVRASLLRLSRYQVVFEVYNPYSILQLSEVLNEFKIVMNDRLVYSGRAVVSNLVNTGLMLICETTLQDSWLDVDLFSPVNQRDKLLGEFAEFVQEWRKVHRIVPDFKVVVADIQTLLMDLRRWFEQLELGVRSQPVGDRANTEREVIQELQGLVLPTVSPLLERFEEIANSLVVEELRPMHRTYIKRQLHPVVLCSPFIYRTYQKPLGYAGDYEMVNMMVRDPYEGSSMFAKMLNYLFLNTPPVVAHRNRITWLTRKLEEETRRVAQAGRVARILNLGCGPAKEIQDFLRRDELSERASFSLLDFNDETLLHTSRILDEVKRGCHRSTAIQAIKKSVHQVLKEATRPGPELEPGTYDLVYCAGLFDYLSDRICKRLMNIFYDLLAPGGLLVVTNVDASNPSRNWMEYVLEWHLIYRDHRLLQQLAPDAAPPGTLRVNTEATGVNIFLEVRKPAHA
jgi:extracellular factor (EF) 3-hydroxypalmitic acid methyl ester biosynthesis protein